MRSRSASATVLAVLLLAGCGGHPAKRAATPGSEDRHAPVLGTAWAAAHLKSLGGLTGKFRSEVITRACTQPITAPCTVGGAAAIDVGTFTLHSHSTNVLHTAFGNGADVTELTGYRVVGTTDSAEYLKAVSGSRSSCWKLIYRGFGAGWDYPDGFDVVDEAEPLKDPPVGGGAAELVGLAPTELVLDFLGVPYLDWFDKVVPDVTQVPVHLRIDKAGHAAGFWVDGEEVSNALVGPAPHSPKAQDPAAFVPEDDAYNKAWIRRYLSPVHGEFSMYAFGSEHEITKRPAPLCKG